MHLNFTIKTCHFSFLACEDYGKIQCPETETCYDPNYDVCDEYDDCGDNWDEQNCSKSRITTS